jgi:hypothetical protein
MADKGRDFGPEQFLSGYGFSEMCPDLEPSEWDVRSETSAAAVKRLGKRKRDRLRAIAEQAEAAGFCFLDARPDLRRDLGWLFRHVALGQTYAVIAAAAIAAGDLTDDPEGRGPETVKKAVGRVAASARLVLR